MKNIFKKNSIIITALAIMIVIAGYISFTNRDATKDKATDADVIATSGTDVEGYDVGTDTTADTTDDTTTADDADTTDDTTTVDDTDATDDTTADTAEDTVAENAASDELGDSDISDEDILADASDVTDNGELNPEDGTPGDAVLASSTVESGYFVSSRLEREQVRAKNKETLMDIISSTDVTEEEKKDALQSMIRLTEISEKESAAEILLGAKGFEDSVVFIVDEDVDVVVNAASLTDQQLAIIEDVVKNETDIPVANIEIIPTVMSD